MTTKGKFGELNPRYRKAAQLLNRKNGATVDDLANKLGMEQRPARLIIDRLRRKGLSIENVGRARFKLTANDRRQK